MTAGLCLVGHVVEYIDTCLLEERLLKLPTAQVFELMTADLSTLKGCYLFFNRVKDIWIRSGKTAGEGPKSNFSGRDKKHIENSKQLEAMKKSKLYQLYPARGVPNLGAIDGYFDDLDTFVGMAFDRRSDNTPLCSINQKDSVFVWSERTMQGLGTKGGDIQKAQLVAVAYLWELVYNLLLANSDDVSEEPGFESYGLRVNKLARREGDDSNN